eukprot:jgi/Tetstr1/428931/TSEL_018907.t1
MPGLLAPRLLLQQLTNPETSSLPWAAALRRPWQASQDREGSFHPLETVMASSVAPVGNPVDRAGDTTTAYAVEPEPYRVALRKCCGIAALGDSSLGPED